jgi:hypothetical protein
MAVFTRTAGNAQNVVSVGAVSLSTESTSLLVPISIGIGKPVQCFRVAGGATLATEMGTGEAVEAILKTVALNSTVLVYQVNTSALSVMVEDSSWTATSLVANVNAMGASVGTNGYDCSTLTVTDAGFKLTT